MIMCSMMKRLAGRRLCVPYNPRTGVRLCPACVLQGFVPFVCGRNRGDQKFPRKEETALKIYRRLKPAVWLTVINLLIVVALPAAGSTSGRAGLGRDPNPPPFDFSDNFYEANGIN